MPVSVSTFFVSKFNMHEVSMYMYMYRFRFSVPDLARMRHSSAVFMNVKFWWWSG